MSGKQFSKMKDETNPSDLEKIARKSEEMIICEVPDDKCELRGDFWKCYMGNYIKCSIYTSWVVKRIK